MSGAAHSFGTGYLHTTIGRDGAGGYLWTRRPGPDRHDALRVPDPALLAPLRAASREPVALVLPEHAEPGAVTFRTTQAVALAGLMLRNGPDLETAAAGTMTGAGSALARLHAVP
ncbi:hypothetical protein OUY22_33055, partial [Nonomuraea sp. MCN248]|nr:hypothetical protein [Nonomuraea corallina]